MSSAQARVAGEKQQWRKLIGLDQLEAAGIKMCRLEGKQIAVFNTSAGVRACDNRCPHEGYPLAEGDLSDQCILTCNWHNWKFNLDSGENLYGGDCLRTYPTEIRDGDVWVDIAELPFADRHRRIGSSLREAFKDYSYDRIAREIARLIHIGGDPLDALRWAIDWSWQKMEFGWTHAYAGMADWLSLYDENPDEAELQLVCLVESVTHAAFDVLREGDFEFSRETAAYDEERFVAAIEAEDEAAAVAAINGGIEAGLGFDDFECGLTRAALQHYNDFGHSLIYVTKAGLLIERLGSAVMRPLLLSLVREMIYASREDRIPEFRAYAKSLAKWGRHNNQHPEPDLWRREGINKALKLVVDCSASPPEQIYHALLIANAVNMLGFDIAQQDKIHVSVSGNVGWLDFTHGLTFANAVRQQCTRFPDLWPQGLLQMACFSGRNAAFTQRNIDFETWKPANPRERLEQLLLRVFDHGQGEHIVSVHLLKTLLAVRDEIELLADEDAQLLVAALWRFIESPLKRRQARRTAYQSLQFVARE